jgi:hypothetical protein
MYANIMLRADVVAAREPLQTFVRVYPNSTWRDTQQVGYDDLPSHLLMVFDGATCDSILKDFKLTKGCNVRMCLNNNMYTAGYPISYPGGGEYGNTSCCVQ